MKILYAAGNYINSKIMLMRFIDAIKDKNYKLRIAAYVKSTPNINVDWTLDAMLDVVYPDVSSLEHDNVAVYYEQIKSFHPDLIISDLDYFTSYIGNLLGIPVWHYSSVMLNFALTTKSKNDAGTHKFYYSIINKAYYEIEKRISIINGANCNFVYSHFGDTLNPPELKSGFEWIRPYHYVGKPYKPCEHNIVATVLDNNKQIIHCLKQYEDSIMFSQFPNEMHKNITMKNVESFKEYACNLFNSKLAMSEGQTSFLADAFYNHRYSIIKPNFNEAECVLNSLYTQHFNLGALFLNKQDMTPYMNSYINYTYKPNIKYLHEKIVEFEKGI